MDGRKPKCFNGVYSVHKSSENVVVAEVVCLVKLSCRGALLRRCCRCRTKTPPSLPTSSSVVGLRRRQRPVTQFSGLKRRMTLRRGSCEFYLLMGYGEERHVLFKASFLENFCVYGRPLYPLHLTHLSSAAKVGV